MANLKKSVKKAKPVVLKTDEFVCKIEHFDSISRFDYETNYKTYSEDDLLDKESFLLKLAVRKNKDFTDAFCEQVRESFEVNEMFGVEEFEETLEKTVNRLKFDLGEEFSNYLISILEVSYIKENIKENFALLAENWYLETLHSSGYIDKVLHPAYQRIIGLGKDVIPFILRELQDEPSEWFWALRALTGEDPTTKEPAGNREKLAEAWLNWGKENGYI
jgi:hypothetical protein